MIPRTLFAPEHETFRDSVRRFLEAEVRPHDEKWQEQGYADKSVWKKAGENGFLCMSMPEEYGGSGADKLFSMVLMEEQARINNSSVGWGLHSEIVAPPGQDAVRLSSRRRAALRHRAVQDVRLQRFAIAHGSLAKQHPLDGILARPLARA